MEIFRIYYIIFEVIKEKLILSKGNLKTQNLKLIKKLKIRIKLN